MNLFVFGATGDLFKRKVLPALQELNSSDLNIVGIGRKEFVEENFRNYVCSNNCTPNFRQKINYIQVDFEKSPICKDCEKYFDKEGVNYFYISLPPKLMYQVINEIITYKKKEYIVNE